jgi:hypothetical protein
MTMPYGDPTKLTDQDLTALMAEELIRLSTRAGWMDRLIREFLKRHPDPDLADLMIGREE